MSKLLVAQNDIFDGLLAGKTSSCALTQQFACNYIYGKNLKVLFIYFYFSFYRGIDSSHS